MTGLAEQIGREGLTLCPNVLASSECEAILQSLASSGVQRSRAGARHLMRHPVVAKVANDPRLRSLVTEGLGRPGVPFRATLFDKSARANWSVVWHQDTALPLSSRFEAEGWGPWSRKCGVLYAHAPTAALERILALRIHLDDSGPANGPLSVVHRSHSLGVLSDEEVSNVVRATPHVECLVPRGGILLMRPLLIHSSGRVTTRDPRRVLHIEYAEDLEVVPSVRLAIA